MNNNDADSDRLIIRNKVSSVNTDLFLVFVIQLYMQ